MPPKGKRPSAATEAFLFVNEDFNTLFGGAKNADLDRSKQSHVQRQSFAKRRRSQRGGIASSASSPTPSEDAQSPAPRAPLLSLPASSSLWLPAVPDESAGTGTAAVTQNLSSFSASPIPQWRSPSHDFSQQNPYPLAQWEQSLSSQSPLDSRLTSLPFSTLPVPIEPTIEYEGMFSIDPVASMPMMDPFSNVQLALERWAPPLMRYFTMKMVPEFCYTDLRAVPLHRMRHVEYLHQDMRSCMSNPAEMYALLAVSACHALEKEGRLDLPDLDPEDSVRVTHLFKSKAFEALRLRLSSGELSQGVVIAIQRMICAALHVGNHLAVEPHYRAALSMIRTIGGLETFNDFQKERLIMHDFSYALSTGSPPRIELTWDPGELVADMNLELVIHMKQRDSYSGERIRSIAQDAEVVLHSTVATCIPGLVETQQVLAWLREGPYRPEQYRWLVHRRLAIIHRLLTVGETRSASLSNVVRLALLYYCIAVKALPSDVMVLVDQYVVPELKEWDTGALTDAFEPHADLSLWVMVLFGTGITRQVSHTTSLTRHTSQHSSPQRQGSRKGSEEGRNFDVTVFAAKVGHEACKTLGIVNEVQLRELMRTFLFDDDLVDDRFRSFVREGLNLQGATL